jgi:hypothetical protein
LFEDTAFCEIFALGKVFKVQRSQPSRSSSHSLGRIVNGYLQQSNPIVMTHNPFVIAQIQTRSRHNPFVLPAKANATGYNANAMLHPKW